MKTYQVLCIDDDEQFLASLESALPDKVTGLCSAFQCAFDFVTTPAEAMEVMASAGQRNMQPAMVVSDQVMPGQNGIDLIEKMKARYPDVVCVLLTGHAGLDSAKYAINRHLLDQYVSKPIEDLQEFASLLANLLRGHHLGLEERQRTEELARTVEQLRQANENIRAMQTAAEQVAMLSKNLKVLDFDEIVNIIASEVPRLFGAQWSVVCLPPNGCPAEGTTGRKCPCPDSVLMGRKDIANALRTGQSLCGHVTEGCQNVGAKSPDVVVPLSIACGPLQGRPQPPEKAYLCMCGLAEPMRDDLALMKYKADLIQEILSANLTNARLYQEAREQSRVDSLTGVGTRRVLDSSMEEEYERSARYGHPFCLAMLDVDRFKDVNDTHGHETGDRLLKELAEVLRKEARATDVVARYGGDEFVVLMPETSLDDGALAAERIRQGARSIVLPGGQAMSVSIGLAQWLPGTVEHGADVLRRADSALYQAKREGRDRTSVSAAA